MSSPSYISQAMTIASLAAHRLEFHKMAIVIDSTRLMPTSITTVRGLIQSPFTMKAGLTTG